MPAIDEKVEKFIASRKEQWRGDFKKDPGKAAELLRRYGKTDMLNAAFQGLQQGMSHGFADDVERATSGGVAKNQILAQASEPGVYALAQILGLAGTGALIRGGGAAVGKARGARVAQGSGSLGASAGGAAKAQELAKRARDIEETWAATGMKGVDPRIRGLVLDAGHGAAVGYGGQDPTHDEEALSGERLKRAGLGVLFSAIGGPLATSGGVALGNLPLLFGKRRAFSEKMLEPTGVTRKNPAGNPRQAIEIARAKDESMARAQGGSGIIARDKATPLESAQPNIQKLADQALEPIAADRVAAAARAEREAAADAIARAYPDTFTRRNSTAQERRFTTSSGKDYVVDFADIPGAGGVEVGFRRQYKGRGARRALKNPWWSDGKTPLTESREVLGKVKGAIEQDMREGGRDRYVMLSMEPRRAHIYGQMAKRAKLPEGYLLQKDGELGAVIARVKDWKKENLTKYVDDMMEAFARQDRPALDSWISTLQVANRNNPEVLPAVQAAVARQLAMNERVNPAANNTPVMRDFLNALEMGPSKAKGRADVLEAARGPAAAANKSQRYQEAIKRMVGQPKMRPRHAEALRAEMETYKPGAYTGPWDPRQGPATVLRGDDQARWLNPIDYARKNKVAHSDVTAAGALSGPMALAGEKILDAFSPPGQWRDAPTATVEEDPERKTKRPTFPAAAPRGLIEQMAPAETENPLVARAAEINAPMEVKEAQEILAGAAGLPLERFGADGVKGPETTLAISKFQQAARLDVTGELDDMTKRRLRQLRDGLLPPEMVDEIKKGLTN